jgi:hypothetical protein
MLPCRFEDQAVCKAPLYNRKIQASVFRVGTNLYYTAQGVRPKPASFNFSVGLQFKAQEGTLSTLTEGVFKEHPSVCPFLELAPQTEKVVGCIKKFHMRDGRYFDSRHRVEKPDHEIEATLYDCGGVCDDRCRSSERHA